MVWCEAAVAEKVPLGVARCPAGHPECDDTLCAHIVR
jgi:hypothetical protein